MSTIPITFAEFSPPVLEQLQVMLRGLKGDKGDVGDVTPEALAAKAAAEAARDVAVPAAATATTQASNATSAASAAATAQVGAEGARDSALIQAGVYVDEPTGRAAVADGVAFKVQGSGDTAALEYRRVNSGSSTLIASYPAAAAVQRPVWAAKANGWPDQNFRRSTPGVDFLGRVRWGSVGGTPGYLWTVVANAAFKGNALRKSVNGTGNLSGPLIYLDDMGAVAGDTITIAAIIVGTGGVAVFPMRAQTSAGVSLGTQVSALTDTGLTTLTTSAVPQRMSATFVVPATGTQVLLYPYSNTAGQSFDIVALWAFKGAQSSGPQWPTYSETDVLESLLNTQGASVEGLKAPVVYGFDNYGQVTASATAISLDGTSFSTNPRDLVFRGWGEAYTPAGVSFNAIRVKTLSRTAALTTSRWRTIRVLVRTGASSTGASAPVVAVGNTTVLERSDTLTDLTILLKDPVSGLVKTLTDADFSGGQYFVAVWAENASGAAASCGEPRGTMTNSLGQSYYITSAAGSPVTSAWTAAAGGSNVRLAFQHLLLTAPVESAVQKPSQALADDLGSLAPMPAPDVVLPPYVFGVQNRECNVYLDNLHFDDAATWLHDVTSASSTGQQQAERWTWTPTAALVSGTLSVAVHDKRTGTLLSTKTAQQRAAAATAGAGLNKKVLVVGDSLVNAGTITQTLLDIAADDVMGVTLLGTQGTAPNKHEGRGGWTVSDYTTVGRTYYRFTVSGVITAPAINSTKYSNNGAVFTVQEVALTGGAGTITCSVDSGTSPAASGTLTRTFGTGDASIAFSASAAVPGNPFWKSGAINFAQYLTDNSVAVPDWVFIALGINDVFGQTADAATSTVADYAFTALDILIASIKAADAGTKVGLMLPSPPSASQDSFGANYATGQTRWRDKRNILIWARQLIAKYAGQEASRIYIVPSNTALDTVNNMSVAAAAPVNSRSTVNVARQNNGVHPGTTGYQQIGDALWAFLKYFA